MLMRCRFGVRHILLLAGQRHISLDFDCSYFRQGRTADIIYADKNYSGRDLYLQNLRSTLNAQ